MLLHRCDRRAQHHWPTDEHVLPEIAIGNPGAAHGEIATGQHLLDRFLIPPLGKHRFLDAVPVREVGETPAVEPHLGAHENLGHAIPRHAPSQADLQAPGIIGVVVVECSEQPGRVLRFEGIPCGLKVGAGGVINRAHLRNSLGPLWLAVEFVRVLANSEVPHVECLRRWEGRQETRHAIVRQQRTRLSDRALRFGGERCRLHPLHESHLLRRELVAVKVELCDEVEIVLPQFLRIVPKVCREICGEVSGDPARGADTQPINVGVGNPILHQVRVDLLETHIHGVELIVVV
mmetsp:Transcript_28196/g.81698  ORF Transcript_28196/g.81698 Transcript_28196/m.81698 type:complete len:291 (+) Transcript_28196:4667-5539(+)